MYYHSDKYEIWTEVPSHLPLYKPKFFGLKEEIFPEDGEVDIDRPGVRTRARTTTEAQLLKERDGVYTVDLTTEALNGAELADENAEETFVDIHDGESVFPTPIPTSATTSSTATPLDIPSEPPPLTDNTSHEVFDLISDSEGVTTVDDNIMITDMGETIEPDTNLAARSSREAVLMGDVKLEYCETSEMIADILTKPLPSKQHAKLAKLILNN
jgi:hypothetical protein